MNEPGRAAQRARTRQTIVRAAASLLSQGQRPTLDDVADAAGVSRATAYRYFPGLDALLNEAAVDLLVPEPDNLFDALANDGDALERLIAVDRAIDHAARKREVPLRLMLARILERSAHSNGAAAPLRQNRRVPLIERALLPFADQIDRQNRDHLIHALAIVIGSESFIALKDVVGLDDAEAEDVRHWAIAALLDAATKPAGQGGR